ncbi:class I SAM-dependent methyltransferase [Litorilinea aerophila]|uniref:Class I SAM-dependent methyltransferase n=1 Tax=Litorilinea aerophila TaxID=1204385 RepID=A0A540VD79_9CHLR|nr:methyltransferase domain-containing protein [Litorilinea aerophila]MCC9077582.1 class I SAM-dependent methyltransferase [Litorilinea aerophila]
MLRRIQQQLTKTVNFNSSRARLYLVIADFASQIPLGAKVFDAGAGEAPYRALFQHAQYHSADFTKVDKLYAAPTYVCDLAAIPVLDEWYEYILLTQVIEHLPEPLDVLIELRRLLKPRGKILITGPLFYEEHEEPYDFYRYTQYGLRYLIEKAGFSIERIDWLEGFYGTIGYQLNRIGRYLPWTPHNFQQTWERIFFPPWMIGMKALFFSLSMVFHRLELRHKYTVAGYPKNYVVIASKH